MSQVARDTLSGGRGAREEGSASELQKNRKALRQKNLSKGRHLLIIQRARVYGGMPIVTERKVTHLHIVVKGKPALTRKLEGRNGEEMLVEARANGEYGLRVNGGRRRELDYVTQS